MINWQRHCCGTICILYCWLHACLLPAHAASFLPGVVAAFPIPGVLQADQHGVYDQIFAAAGESLGKQWQFAYYPAARTNLMLRNNTGCIFPADPDHLPEVFSVRAEQVVASEPFNQAKVFIFSPAGGPVYRSLEQLKGKRVGTRRGLPYGTRLAQMIKQGLLSVEEVESDEVNVQKMSRRRIDAMLAYFPDMTGLRILHPRLPFPAYAPAHPVMVHHDRIICRRSQLNQQLIDEINLALSKLRRSGRLKEMLGPYYVPPAP